MGHWSSSSPSLPSSSSLSSTSSSSSSHLPSLSALSSQMHDSPHKAFHRHRHHNHPHHHRHHPPGPCAQRRVEGLKAFLFREHRGSRIKASEDRSFPPPQVLPHRPGPAGQVLAGVAL